MTNDKIAIHESATSDKVVKFISYKELNDIAQGFIDMGIGGGLFIDEDGEIVITDIYGNSYYAID